MTEKEPSFSGGGAAQKNVKDKPVELQLSKREMMTRSSVMAEHNGTVLRDAEGEPYAELYEKGKLAKIIFKEQDQLTKADSVTGHIISCDVSNETIEVLFYDPFKPKKDFGDDSETRVFKLDDIRNIRGL